MVVCAAQKHSALSLNKVLLTSPHTVQTPVGGGRKTELSCGVSLLCTCADDPRCKRGKGESEHFLPKYLPWPSEWCEWLCCHLLRTVQKFRTVPDKTGKLNQSFSWQYAWRYPTEVTTTFFTSHSVFPFPAYTAQDFAIIFSCPVVLHHAVHV